MMHGHFFIFFLALVEWMLMETEKYIAKKKSEIFRNPKHWIEVKWGPVIDKEEYVDMATRMVDLITQMEDDLGYSQMLIDFSRLKKITQQAARFAASATRDLGCRKIAGFGIKPQFKAILDLIKERSKKADTIREFIARPEAEAWLAEK
jgi:hypothetical protein